MSRLIDADALIRRWCGMKCGCEREECGREIEPCIVVMAVEEAPTIDAVEVVHGEWIDEANEYDASFGIHDYICSNCNHYADDHIGGHMWYTMYKPNYCPNCGARMKGADDE